MHLTGSRALGWGLAVFVFALIAVAPGSAALPNVYSVHALVSDPALGAPATDVHLHNGWGLVAGPSTPFWVADNGTGFSTLYDGNTGTPLPLVVNVGGSPTGIVFNGTSSFVVSDVGGASGASRFIFSGEDGTLHGWSPAVPPPLPSDQAQLAFTSSSGAVYKGLAIAQTGAGPRLYAADFHNGRVDVFDGSWNLLSTPGAFVDPSIPSGYAPFGIQTIGSRIFVTYAKQGADRHDDVAGQGHGFVDVYTTAGVLLGRVAQHGQLDSPWGLALAPAGFGAFGGDLLIGNFGNGHVNAYKELPNGHFEYLDALRGANGDRIAVDGLWSLQFGNDHAAGPSGTLFFTAGPNNEADGLFGSITSP